MINRNFDWSSFQIDYYFPASREDLFKSFSTAKGLTSFFLAEAMFASSEGNIRKVDDPCCKNDTYFWKWRQGHEVRGHILDVKENEGISLTFGKMNITIELNPSGEDSLLRLTQTGIPDSEEGRIFSHMNCRLCWVFFLANLKSVLIHGADLRHPDPNRTMSFEVREMIQQNKFSLSEQVKIEAKAEDIFAAILSGRLFNLTGASDIAFEGKKGATFMLRFQDRGQIEGEFREVENPYLILLSWNVSGFGLPDECSEVRLRINETNARKSYLQIEHSLIPSESSRQRKESAWQDILKNFAREWSSESDA